MKTVYPDDKIFRGRSTESKSFGFTPSGKAFKAFSSSLYTRKIRAVVRETMTNGLDGHIKNGNPEERSEEHTSELQSH